MRRSLFALVLPAILAAGTPATAQSQQDQQRWDTAQERYDRETELFQRERERYDIASRSYRSGQRDGRGRPVPPPPPGGDRFATDYDAARDYRDGPGYRERTLGANDQVYRGSDGRMYCKRSDGTTGLIAGGAAGGILGNVLDGGRNRGAGTLIGGALGALLGRSVEQNQSEVRCR